VTCAPLGVGRRRTDDHQKEDGATGRCRAARARPDGRGAERDSNARAPKGGYAVLRIFGSGIQRLYVAEPHSRSTVVVRVVQPARADFAERHSRTPADRPFIIHLAEGIDAASHADFDNLVAGGALDERTVVVHGLALDQHAASVFNRQRASLIWCPSSNVFLFERTHTPDALSNFRNVAIGSDSPLTSTGDFLDELRFAFHQIGASPETIYTMATTEAARVLRLPPGSGQIRVGATADLVVIRGTESTTPARKLSDLTFRDVHLVLRGGRVQLASNDILPRIPAPLAQGLRPLEIDGLVRWVRAPLGRMFSSARDVLGDAVSLNGRRLRNVATDWL